MIKLFMETVKVYAWKTRNQSIHNRLTAEVHTTVKMQEEIQQEVTQIKNTLAVPARNTTTFIHLQAFKNLYMLKPALIKWMGRCMM